MTHRLGLRIAALGQQGAGDAAVVPDDHGREHHAQDRYRQKRLNHAGFTQVAPQQQGQQCKSELASLRDDHAGAQGFEPAAGGRLGRDGHDGGFDHQHARQDCRHQQQIAQQQTHIQQHADGDEKQSQQHFAIGADGGFDLMAKLGFGQHHAGEKCA